MHAVSTMEILLVLLAAIGVCLSQNIDDRFPQSPLAQAMKQLGLPPPPPGFQLPVFLQAQQQQQQHAQVNNQSPSQQSNTQTVNRQSPLDQQAVLQPFSFEKSILQFGLDLHRVITTGYGPLDLNSNCAGSQKGRTSNGNVVYSPLSIAATLSVLLQGSNGNTFRELVRALRYPDVILEDDLHSGFSQAMRQIFVKGRGVDVSISSRLFLKNDYSIYMKFLTDSRKYYNSTVQRMRFDRGSLAQRAINDWVKQQTQGKIPQLLANPPDPSTVLLIANAVHFAGAWQSQFDEQLTAIAPFKVNNEETFNVYMMVNLLDLPYLQDKALGLSIVGLPYVNTDFGLFLVLPDKEGQEGLRELESWLNADALVDIIGRMRPTSIAVNIPRFKLEYSLDATSALRRLGVCDLLNPSSANLSRITPLEDLYLNEVVHRAVIDVDEVGTEAAAATAVTLTREGTSRAFRANRPFLFFLRDNLTGLPFFIGRVVRPTRAHFSGQPFRGQASADDP